MNGLSSFAGEGLAIDYGEIGYGQSFGENVVIISAGRGSLNRQKKRRENISLDSKDGGECLVDLQIG